MAQIHIVNFPSAALMVSYESAGETSERGTGVPLQGCRGKGWWLGGGWSSEGIVSGQTHRLF